MNMVFYPDERIGLFIDGANLYTALRALKLEIDYARLLSEFQSRGRLIQANYYTALLPDHQNAPLKPLVDWLGYNGYNVVTKPAKTFQDPATGVKRIKGNMDIELCVDALAASKWLDHLVLFSGDGDFCPMVRALQQNGVRVSVVSTALSRPSVIADELKRQADTFWELAELVALIRPEPKTPDHIEA